jgi:biopolymer transport protein ExbD
MDEVFRTPEQLAEQLAQCARNSENPAELRVDLFAEKEVSLQELYRVLDLIKSAGVEKVALQAAFPAASHDAQDDEPLPAPHDTPASTTDTAP